MAAPPPHYALKRTILMVSCVIGIAITLYKGVTRLVKMVDGFPPWPWNSYILTRVELQLKLSLLLTMICGLLGAWSHSLVTTYISAGFQVVFFLFWFWAIRLDGWLDIFLHGVLLCVTICFLIDLHKMKRNHSFKPTKANV